MASVFKKLISSELGENNYNKYFFVCQKSLQNKVFDSKEIYNDIYENLKNKDRITIKKMQGRLNDAMFLAIRISKTYFFSFLFFIGAIFFLITKDLHPIITILSILLMIMLFLAKTYEFIVNKYCFIDAHIVLVYKTVLDKMLIPGDGNNNTGVNS
ncbi:hypothetical protein acsn021_10720 [Anaerocolumna cellulosilytica]|uniref:Uncharacterized protein n=1 Tax=Anaerocolumna cellulosilytica TaxID=433286 RepID=A0A6S6QQ89_9FIRM|nr:hypothetical protein [Anaerocolumna cellulosilytica]MBB5194559.1 hypothetical protein [Anaerocolumna cellulosilytica]BCJ93503.1 hypothetical protein acsn021_10720 [Anaerocolumna cellulosilytica]